MNCKCTICEFVREGDEAVSRCPRCGARAIFFVPALEPPWPVRREGGFFREGYGGREANYPPGDGGCIELV